MNKQTKRTETHYLCILSVFSSDISNKLREFDPTDSKVRSNKGSRH